MRKVAVIDDNDDLLFTVKLGLKKENKDVEVFTFNDPNEFLEVSKREKFDIIFLDIMMPQKNGWDTFVDITNNNSMNKNTPIIFLTAKTDEQSERVGSTAANAYMTKPFNISDLSDKINECLK